MSRELIKRCRSVIKCAAEIEDETNCPTRITRDLLIDIDNEIAKPEPSPVDIDWPEYHYQGMGCGLEDRCITDRYEAMRYGWDEALDRAAERLPEKIYTEQPDQSARIAELIETNNTLADALGDAEIKVAELEQQLAEFNNPKNWTRPYNYRGELINEHALYLPSLLNKPTE